MGPPRWGDIFCQLLFFIVALVLFQRFACTIFIFCTRFVRISRKNFSELQPCNRLLPVFADEWVRGGVTYWILQMLRVFLVVLVFLTQVCMQHILFSPSRCRSHIQFSLPPSLSLSLSLSLHTHTYTSQHYYIRITIWTGRPFCIFHNTNLYINDLITKDNFWYNLSLIWNGFHHTFLPQAFVQSHIARVKPHPDPCLPTPHCRCRWSSMSPPDLGSATWSTLLYLHVCLPACFMH